MDGGSFYSTYTPNYTSSDYNGFYSPAGNTTLFNWNSPPAGVMADYLGPDKTPNLETREYSTLQAYSQATGQDTHSVMLDYSVLRNVPELNAKDIASLQNLYEAEDLDFRLVPNSAAVDRGLHLPNVNDDFNGAAPDLGALEVGGQVPHYGPR